MDSGEHENAVQKKLNELEMQKMRISLEALLSEEKLGCKILDTMCQDSLCIDISAHSSVSNFKTAKISIYPEKINDDVYFENFKSYLVVFLDSARKFFENNLAQDFEICPMSGASMRTASDMEKLLFREPAITSSEISIIKKFYSEVKKIKYFPKKWQVFDEYFYIPTKLYACGDDNQSIISALPTAKSKRYGIKINYQDYKEQLKNFDYFWLACKNLEKNPLQWAIGEDFFN